MESVEEIPKYESRIVSHFIEEIFLSRGCDEWFQVDFFRVLLQHVIKTALHWESIGFSELASIKEIIWRKIIVVGRSHKLHN